MNLEDHCKKSKELFGEEGRIYHTWINKHKEEYESTHRRVLHHREGVRKGVELFGEKSRPHLEQHIMDDYKIGHVPSKRGTGEIGLEKR